MAYAVYRFTLKSQELRGASQPNIITIALNSDADATTFKANVELVFDAKVVSIDKVVSSNYALPYPAGTNRMGRIALWDDASQTEQCLIWDLNSNFEPFTFSTALIGAGIKIIHAGVETPATRANTYAMTPGPSH